LLLFTITTSTQKKTASNKEAQTEKKCCAKEADSKAMTAAEVSKCQAKCKLKEKM
jgi:hypothetical protein